MILVEVPVRRVKEEIAVLATANGGEYSSAYAKGAIAALHWVIDGSALPSSNPMLLFTDDGSALPSSNPMLLFTDDGTGKTNR